MGFRFASYNIHRCYGLDSRHDPERIRCVLRELNAQLYALQEVELSHEAPDLLNYLCEDRPWQAISGITMQKATGHYGNALLTSLPIASVNRIDLSVPGREPRGALQVRVTHAGEPIEIVATHLGLRPAERRMQIRQLLSLFSADKEQPSRILMGDLNEWFLWGRPLRWLKKHFKATPALASFPAYFPLFALDRIWAQPRERLSELKVFKSPTAGRASDHLPLSARFD